MFESFLNNSSLSGCPQHGHTSFGVRKYLYFHGINFDLSYCRRFYPKWKLLVVL